MHMGTTVHLQYIGGEIAFCMQSPPPPQRISTKEKANHALGICHFYLETPCNSQNNIRDLTNSGVEFRCHGSFEKGSANKCHQQWPTSLCFATVDGDFAG